MSEPDEALERIQLNRAMHFWQCADGHRCGTDDVLCAWAGFISRPEASRALDLGTGQGSVALMLAHRMPSASFVAIEAQEISFRLLTRNVEENGLSSRVTRILGDLRHTDPGGSFDLITGSPPFRPPGSGILPRKAQRAAARFEMRGGIEDYCLAAGRYLAPGGRAVFLLNGDTDGRARAAVSAAGLVLTRRWIVERDHPIPRFILYGMERPPGEAMAETRLRIRDASGEFTREYLRLREDLDLP